MESPKDVQPFKPWDQNLNSHLLPLFISYRSSGEKLIKIKQIHLVCYSQNHSVLQGIDNYKEKIDIEHS